MQTQNQLQGSYHWMIQWRVRPCELTPVYQFWPETQWPLELGDRKTIGPYRLDGQFRMMQSIFPGPHADRQDHRLIHPVKRADILMHSERTIGLTKFTYIIYTSYAFKANSILIGLGDSRVLALFPG